MLLTHDSALGFGPPGPMVQMLGMMWAELEEVGEASALDPSVMEVRVRLTGKEVWATHIAHLTNRDQGCSLPEGVKDPPELR